MSHALVNRIKQMTGFSLAEKSVLYRLADESHDGKTVFLRLDRLALYTGCSRSTVQRALRHLESRGYLIEQGGKGGRGYVHVYRINLEPNEEEPQAEEMSSPNGAATAEITLEFLRRQDDWTLEEMDFWAENNVDGFINPIVHLQEMEEKEKQAR